MPREAYKWQKTLQIGATRYPMRCIDEVTKRAIDYLRARLKSHAPWIREYKPPERKYQFKTTPLATVAHLNVILWIEHDGRPLPPALKSERDFNLVQQAVRNGSQSKDERSFATRIADALRLKK